MGIHILRSYQEFPNHILAYIIYYRLISSLQPLRFSRPPLVQDGEMWENEAGLAYLPKLAQNSEEIRQGDPG